MEIRPIISALLRNKIGAILIALQIALTLTIITNSAFIIQQRKDEVARPSGMNESDTFFVAASVFAQTIDIRQRVREDLDALNAMPGVLAATPIQSVPLSGGGWGEDFYLHPEQPSNETINFGNFMVNEDGVEALGLEMVAGRNFTADEIGWRGLTDSTYPDRVIISQALADALFPDGDAVGQLVYDEPAADPTRIIGVYRRMQNAWPSSSNVELTGIMPQISEAPSMRYFIRAEPGARDRVMAEVEQLLAAQPGRIIRIVRSIEEQKQRIYADDVAMIRLLSGVVLLLTLITAFGIVGLARFSVTQRRKQIGTRRALGARRRDIVRYFMLENWLITSVGIVVGVAGSVALNYFLDNEFQTGRLEWFYLPLGMIFLWLLGQLAVLEPARRAAGVPPALATRSV